MTLRALHVVGRQNAGKTTLLVELIAELTRRGVAVGTIKHSSHPHEIDTPGKDSHRHREAGAHPAAVVTPELVATFVPRAPDSDFYALLEPLYRACELVIVEGNIDGPGPKVEVWRARAGGELPLAAERDDIVAVISDDPVGVGVPVWPRSDPRRIADELLKLPAVGDQPSARCPSDSDS